MSTPQSNSNSNPPPSNPLNSNTNETDIYDVIIVGGGNAGFSAASTAAQTLHSHSHSHLNTHSHPHPHAHPRRPPRILLQEKDPHPTPCAKTISTAGAYRFTYTSLSDLRPLLSYNGNPGIPESLASRIEMAPYTQADFRSDLDRVTSGRADPELARVLVERSRECVDWIARNGGGWELSFHRQAYEVDGKYKFWGGLVVCFAGGGKGLVAWHEELARREGVQVWYGCEVVDLVVRDCDGNGVGVGVGVGGDEGVGIGVEVCGVDVVHGGRRRRFYARGGVVLATGGFQANTDMRKEWLGPDWANAHVRGSATNTGDGHTLLLTSPTRRVRAKRAGHYAGCHSVCWDASSPADGGDRLLTNQYTKSGYPLGIMVNTLGERFVDEGADLRNYTYAIFGREVLRQPGGVAWQVWDDEGRKLLRKEEYDDSVTELITADTLEALAMKLGNSGLKDQNKFLETIEDFNTACLAFQEENPDVKFDPASRDGLSTQSSKSGLKLPKSNWARPLLKAPFTAVKITCGVTFTFGGVAVDPETAGVIAESDDECIEEHEISGDVGERGDMRNGAQDSSVRTDDLRSSEASECDADVNDKAIPDGGSSKASDHDRVPSRRPRSKVIPGLYCAGELLGGLFWDNYPGGSGLTAGTVFGRIAGQHAAEKALKSHR